MLGFKGWTGKGNMSDIVVYSFTKAHICRHSGHAICVTESCQYCKEDKLNQKESQMNLWK